MLGTGGAAGRSGGGSMGGVGSAGQGGPRCGYMSFSQLHIRGLWFDEAC